jgi:hypothetical protein
MRFVIEVTVVCMVIVVYKRTALTFVCNDNKNKILLTLTCVFTNKPNLLLLMLHSS